jgi:DNA replication protein DnaC
VIHLRVETTREAVAHSTNRWLRRAEVEATSARRLSGRLRFAHYPLDKRLAQFEFDFQPSIDRAVIAELSTLRFVEERRNALFLGPPGATSGSRARAAGHAAGRRKPGSP